MHLYISICICICVCVCARVLKGTHTPYSWICALCVHAHVHVPLAAVGHCMQMGVAGDSAAGGASKAHYPQFWAMLYDPGAPPNQRFTKLARSAIARMYHSTAALTPEGNIIVAGCDRCDHFNCTDAYSPSPQGLPDYRVEVGRRAVRLSPLARATGTYRTNSLQAHEGPRHGHWAGEGRGAYCGTQSCVAKERSLPPALPRQVSSLLPGAPG
jgi:hypothetical protein